jgi:hypothetical protein
MSINGIVKVLAKIDQGLWNDLRIMSNYLYYIAMIDVSTFDV